MTDTNIAKIVQKLKVPPSAIMRLIHTLEKAGFTIAPIPTERGISWRVDVYWDGHILEGPVTHYEDEAQTQFDTHAWDDKQTEVRLVKITSNYEDIKARVRSEESKK